MPDWSTKTEAELRQAYDTARGRIDCPRFGARAREWLDEIDAELQRRDTEISGIDPAVAEEIRARVDGLPLDARIVQAFTECPASDSEALAIRAVARNPRCTSAALSDAAGWPGESTWHLIFAAMCQRREPWLPPAPPSARETGQLAYSGILCDLLPPRTRFRLKDDAANGFACLGLLAGAT